MNERSTGGFLYTLMLILLGVGIGLVAGYFLWVNVEERHPPDKLRQPVIEIQVPKEKEEAPKQFLALETRISDALVAYDYGVAIELLLELDLLAASDPEIGRVSDLLEESVKLRVVQLESRGRFAEIDDLYESLNYAMPERAEYYLLLAEHRIRMGAADAALPVLAQIENHARLGARARDLLESLSVSAAEPLARLKLIPRGDQFLVSVTIDKRREATLLLDTGASMTVLDPSILRSLGYSLNGQVATFSTANGTLRAPVIAIESLETGRAGVSSLRVGALVVDGEGIDGLLGMDYLSRFNFALDQDGGFLDLTSER